MLLAASLVLCLATGCGSSAAPGRALLLEVGSGYCASKVETVDARGRVVRTLARKVCDSLLSPNRKLVALNEESGLYVARIDGSAPRRLVQADQAYGYLWSPDSKRIVVGSTVVDVATGAARSLSVPPDFDSVAAWSGAAHSLLFETYTPGGLDGLGCCDRRLVVAGPTGGSPRTIYDDGDPEAGFPWASWSPDGRSIAYAYEYETESYEAFGVIDAKTGKTRSIDFSPAIEAPVWAPNSRLLAVQLINKNVVGVFSRAGRLVSTIAAPFARPVAWTDSGLYLVSGSKVLLAPAGQATAQTLFTLPRREEIDAAQPLG
jgi:WD40-like Beta Propeller Repeat